MPLSPFFVGNIDSCYVVYRYQIVDHYDGLGRYLPDNNVFQ